METLSQIFQRTAEDVYFEYANDWLTIDAMADNYQIEPEKLGQIIASVKYAEEL